MELFATCAQGIEPLLTQELTQLGFHQVKSGYRGVFFQISSFSEIYRINYCSRLAGRILYPIMQFQCANRHVLYQKASKVDWSQFLSNEKTFAIDANVSHPLLKNSLFAAQVLKDAICDQFREKTGKRPFIDTQSPDIQLNLFIRDQFAVISLDTSGAPLYKRGYRQQAGEAPIQESLAAALLMLAQFQGIEIVCDPLCGSGTFLIEAALMATCTPPGYLRKEWGFMHLPEFDQQEWLKVKAEADKGKKPLVKGQFFGCDINGTMVQICKTNLRAAGFTNEIHVVKSDFRDYHPPVAPQLMITNPPHGNRLDEVDRLRTLYRSLGDWMKHEIAKPGKGFVFTSKDLAKDVGLAPKKRHVIDYSGVDCRFLEFDVF